MDASIRSVGLIAPGLADWETARRVLAAGAPGARPPEGPIGKPRSGMLPRTEGRRATDLIHMALCAAEQALPADTADSRTMPSVFASADGDLETQHRLCTGVAGTDPWVSPHSFHNSVHNAPSGYWSIALGCQGPSTSLSAGNDSFVAGLLEALMYLESDDCDRCLLVAYDPASPPMFSRARPAEHGFAVALLLAKDGRGPGLRLAFPPDSAAPERLADAKLEQLRRENPAGRSLPLLTAIARGESATVHLPYGDASVAVTLEMPS